MRAIQINTSRLPYVRFILICLFFPGIFFACNPAAPVNSGKADKKTNDEYTVAAYIWPSCHHDARFGDMLWPDGTGEWEVIKKGTPRFEGHYQPKVPLWGYEPDDDPKVMERWIDAATDHGVNVFIFDWYWFDEGPFLENSLNNGFLKAKNNEKMKFYVDLLNKIDVLGSNSVTHYNWGGPQPTDYIRWGVEAMERRDQWDEALTIPFIPNASIGWDDSPRFPNQGKDQIVHLNKSPEAFSSFLQKAKDYCDKHPEQPKMITIFAWNEWIEGGYLLPDIKYGFSYLEAVREVMYNDNNY